MGCESLASKSELDALKAEIQALKNELSGKADRTEMASIWDRIEGISSDVAQAVSDASKAMSSVAQAVSDASKAVAAVGDIASAIGDIMSTIGDLSSKVGSVTSQVASVAGQLAGLVGAIAGLASIGLVLALQSQLGSLQDRMDAMFLSLNSSISEIYSSLHEFKVSNNREHTELIGKFMYEIGASASLLNDRIGDMRSELKQHMGFPIPVAHTMDWESTGIKGIISDYLSNYFEDNNNGDLNNRIDDRLRNIDLSFSLDSNKEGGGEEYAWKITGAISSSTFGNKESSTTLTFNGDGMTEEDREKLDKIFKILGGNRWGDDISLSLNPESLVRGKSALSSDKKEGVSLENNSIIDVIQSFTALVYGRLGLDDYPVKVPKQITEAEPETLEIPHLTRFNSWQTLILDELIGQFPIKMKIEDSDLVKVGDQPVDIKLPNIAETLAEIVGQLIQIKGISDATLNAGLRNLIETGSTRSQSIATYYLLETIQAYLGFKTKQKTEEIEFTFNPTVATGEDAEESIAKALEPKTLKIKVEEFDDEQTLEAQLKLLLEGYRIIKSVHFRKLSPDNKSEWINWIKAIAGLGEGEPNEDGKTDFDVWLEEFERGFTSSSGLDQDLATNPYGRPLNQRPRVREVGVQNDGNSEA